MSIFNLHAAVLTDYRDFVRSFFIIADERTRQFVEHALLEEARLWPDFLLQVSPAYARYGRRTGSTEHATRNNRTHFPYAGRHPLSPVPTSDRGA
ncbi:MAG TPA: hypothetical protein VIH59_20300 [Candidatus Tectomicrobia bacterium]|jgi:hypothetical protein